MQPERPEGKDKTFPEEMLHKRAVETLVTVLFVFASWMTRHCNMPWLNATIVRDFCAHHGIPTRSQNICSTIIDVEVSDNQKESAKNVGITLIPARRKSSLDPQRHPPKLDWLLHHDIYYPSLGELENVQFVVGHDSMTADAARDIRDTLFPNAELHLLKVDLPGVLAVFDKWDIEKYGLPEFHRNLLKDLSSKTGNQVIIYTTVLDVAVGEGQKNDAENAGITLIPGKRAEYRDPENDPIDILWLYNHKSYYEDLKDLKNIQYVIGYAPMTAFAAADIRKSLFPNAKLYQINAIHPDHHARLTAAAQHKLEKDMLRVAKESDAMVSIGPSMYDYFENAYRVITDRAITHIELLPKVGECFTRETLKVTNLVQQHVILSYGELDCCTDVMSDYGKIAESIGQVATVHKEVSGQQLKWNILGIPTESSMEVQQHLRGLLSCDFEVTRLKPISSISQILTYIQQCHICVTGLSHADFGFCGLEAIAAGLPTFVNRDSQLGALITKYLSDYEHQCLVNSAQELYDKMVSAISNTAIAFKRANELKKAYYKCKEVDTSYARFAALFVEAKEPYDASNTEPKPFGTKHHLDKKMKVAGRHGDDVFGFEAAVKGRDDAEEIPPFKANDTNQKSHTMSTETVPDKSPPERDQNIGQEISETKLKQASPVKVNFEEKCKELTQKLEKTEQSFAGQRVKQKTLQSELEQQKQLIKELQDKVVELERDKWTELEHDKKATVSTAYEDLQTRLTEKQDEVESLQQQLTDVSALKQETTKNLLGELENSYECTERKGDCRNIWLIANEERHFYKLPSGFLLEVPPNAVEVSRRLVVTTNNKKRPPLKNYEYYESDVLEIEGVITLKQPVYISRPSLNVDPCERIQVILKSNNGSKWEELKSVLVKGRIQVEVTKFSLFAALSKPVQDTINVSKEGGKWSSSANNQVCLEVPENAVEHPRKFILELHQSDIEEIAQFEAAGESFSPVIYIKEEKASSNPFKKLVTLSIPLPPPLPQDVSLNNTELCILKDEYGNCEWQNITEDCAYDIQEPVLKLTTRSLSGYSIGRCSKDRILTLSQTLSDITKMVNSGTHLVKFVLLQHKLDRFNLRCDILKFKKIPITDESPEKEKYSSYTNMGYSRDRLINPGDVIRNTVTDGFVLTTSLNEGSYYPSIDNHWDVKVGTLSGQNEIPTSGMMQFNRGVKVLCELPFFMSKEQKNSSTEGNAITDSMPSIRKRGLHPLNVLFFKLNGSINEEQQSSLLCLLIGRQIPKRAMNEMNTPFKIFQYLEGTGDITEKNIDLLEEIFEEMNCHKLKELVKEYQRKHITSSQ